mmetsp:Transcript_4058/g.5954  ORF Transcript_4058/g.5954 Transcript_4058/m.5954 type:complete len:965 (+) Transcript_4058:173-3067(+)|eukprot:CAMPEP_0203750410 /NCGR_PEP_ID=MMETSP0098-20131031/4637_1 /ASSEMBLY_ACC=CAM_ASM_000208 /TAXON_ID=96639 /ORGANISM=" , Strain NY0313808BC1" /LENGTH=964 /DNA_ID=CAMNT_0050639683 /DNA_START=142 /DNA_END=3036 /DNA_ORIENTATION=+
MLRESQDTDRICLQVDDYVGDVVAGNAGERVQQGKGDGVVKESWLQRCRGAFNLETRTNQIVFRDTLNLLTCLGIAYAPPIRDFVGHASVPLVAVLSIVSTLLPQSFSSVGAAVNYSFSVLLGCTIAISLGYFAVAAYPHNSGAYLATYFIFILFFMTMGQEYPKRLKLPVAFMCIVLGVVYSEGYRIFNFEPSLTNKQERWDVYNQAIKGVVISIIIPMAVLVVYALVIFPWFVLDGLKGKLKTLWENEGKVLTEYDRVLCLRLNALRCFDGDIKDGQPDEIMGNRKGVGNNPPVKEDENMLGELEKLAKAQLGLPTQVRALLYDNLYDTRFSFRGVGLEMCACYRMSSRMSYLVSLVGGRPPPKPPLHMNEPLRSAILLAYEASHDLLVILVKHIDLLSIVCSRPVRDPACVDILDNMNFSALHESRLAMETCVDAWISSGFMENDGGFGTCFLLYVRSLSKFARYVETAMNSRKESLDNPNTTMSFRFAEMALTCTKPHDSRLYKYTRGPLVGLEVMQHLAWYQVLFRRFEGVTHLASLKTGFKAALAATILLSFAFFPSTQEFFSSAAMPNALSTVFSVFRQTQMGLVGERAVYRIGGMLIGYIAASVIYQIPCASGSCYDTIDGYIPLLLSLPLFPLHFYTRRVYPRQFYAVYSLMKEYQVISLTAVSLQTSPGSHVWKIGGYIVLSSFMGAVLSLIIGTFVFPLTGWGMLRDSLSGNFEYLVTICEGRFYTQFYRTDEDNEDNKSVDIVGLKEHLRNLEGVVGQSIAASSATYIKAMRLEPIHLRQSVSSEQGEKLLAACRNIWMTLFLVHNLLLTRQDSTKEEYRGFIGVRIWSLRRVTAICDFFSSKLQGANFARVVPPVIPPTFADPTILKHELDVIVKRSLVAHPDQPNHARYELQALTALLLELSESFQQIYQFIDEITLSPPYKTELVSLSRGIAKKWLLEDSLVFEKRKTL